MPIFNFKLEKSNENLRLLGAFENDSKIYGTVILGVVIDEVLYDFWLYRLKISHFR